MITFLKPVSRWVAPEKVPSLLEFFSGSDESATIGKQIRNIPKNNKQVMKTPLFPTSCSFPMQISQHENKQETFR